MADVVDPMTRSAMMAGIKGTNTKPEVIVRRYLHKEGFRFRLHVADMPGRPDIVLPKWNAVIEVHGCFWHRHDGCRFATSPSTRPEFWTTKFSKNVERDRRNAAKLLADGWRVATVWECSLKADPSSALSLLSHWLRSDNLTVTIE